jgi:glycosyltransferase involved in cell wall biosynthesis
VNILIFHVHGSWMTGFVQGRHRYLLPVTADRGPWGRGRARTWDWPSSAVEVTPEGLARHDVDVVVLQRPEEEAMVQNWLGGRRPPMVWLEHNAPQGRIDSMRHPAADRSDLHCVQVTHFNDLMWDLGRTPTRVISHGVVDPGHRYDGTIARAAVVVNEPVRRGRVAGTDLLGRLADAAPVDLFGMGTPELHCPPRVCAYDDVPQAQLHDAMALRRVYLHPYRWTSLGLAAIEAMLLGMPVVATATTELPRYFEAGAGVCSNSLDELCAGLTGLLADADLARACGDAARALALRHFDLSRFLIEWDQLLEEIT